MSTRLADARVDAPGASAQARQGFWEGRLGYAHSAVIAAAFFLFGCALHAAVGYTLPVHLSPFGWLIALMVLGSVVVGRVCRTQRVPLWLYGIPTAVVSTVAVCILAILGGVAPESWIQERFGVQTVWMSWPFLMLMTLMLMNLFGTVGKRCWPLSYANFVYLASHFGLAVAIVGGALGSAFKERGLLVLFPGQPVNVADVRDGNHFALPFAVTLKEFTKESFPPVLAFAALDPREEGGVRLTPGTGFVATGSEGAIEGIKYRVEEFIPLAVRTPNGWVAAPWKTAAPAARVTATLPDGKTVTGWVSCGSLETPYEHLDVGEGSALLMPEPRPRRYASLIDIEGVGERTVEVNQPVTVQGYTLYQVSYDSKAGAASAYSVLEAIHDPALPIVYFGMGLMLFGACLHLWNGFGRGAK